MDQSTARITAAGTDGVPAEYPRSEYDGDKPLREIEEDIARTRVRLSATIDALERELAPARVVEKGAEALWKSLEPGPAPVRNQLWAYAIPLAMIVAGLGWLVALRRNNWGTGLPSEFGELPAEAIEVGETPMPVPPYAGLSQPVEPVSLIDQNATI